MKRTPIRRKRKRQGSPSWYKQKVVERFMKQRRGLLCEVCGTNEGTCAHHIIPKGSCPYHIATPMMVIVLCPRCHRWAHGDRFANGDPFATLEFLAWLGANKPEQHAWCLAHRHDTSATLGKIDWEQRWEEI